MSGPLRPILLALALLVLPASQAGAAKLLLSTQGNATLPGLTFTDGDGVIFDPVANSTVLVFDESLFASGNEDINAFHRFLDDTLLISTTGNATLGGLGFGDDDVVFYDPATDTATLFFDGGANFSNGNEDVDAVSVLSNGNLLLSTVGNATLGGLSFSDGDLVEYDAVNDVATLFFDEALFGTNEDIDAVHAFDDGSILLSTQTDATLGGLSFGDDDVVLYHPSTDTAFLFFDGGANFSNGNEDVVAVAVPEPGALALLLAPIVLLARRR